MSHINDNDERLIEEKRLEKAIAKIWKKNNNGVLSLKNIHKLISLERDLAGIEYRLELDL